LPGIAGSLISMADGLAVAKHLPAGTNADALAGFIPDIFTRLTQYTKDLQLGEVNCVTVQVGQQPLQIHRCGKLYLSALGAAGAALPAEQLTALARQLAQLNK
jgi:predicted regulator of Ras-like GTPase activity (Roadblock/LC7/MglB family)